MQRVRSMLSNTRRRLLALRDDQRGVSAVEFAMILPLLVTIYLGGVEITQGVTINRKVALTARAVADLVAQKRTGGVSGNVITAAEMGDIMNAAKAVMTPFRNTNLKVIVSSVVVDDGGVAKVDWSASYNTAARSPGDAVTLPANLLVPNTTIIWGEASYGYTPTVGYIVTGTMNLYDYIYMRPRVHDTICYLKCTS